MTCRLIRCLRTLRSRFDRNSTFPLSTARPCGKVENVENSELHRFSCFASRSGHQAVMQSCTSDTCKSARVPLPSPSPTAIGRNRPFFFIGRQKFADSRIMISSQCHRFLLPRWHMAEPTLGTPVAVRAPESFLIETASSAGTPKKNHREVFDLPAIPPVPKSLLRLDEYIRRLRLSPSIVRPRARHRQSISRAKYPNSP
jgi:hypothetical protein